MHGFEKGWIWINGLKVKLTDEIMNQLSIDRRYGEEVTVFHIDHNLEKDDNELPIYHIIESEGIWDNNTGLPKSKASKRKVQKFYKWLEKLLAER